MRNYFILVLTALISFALCNERTFNLKSGNKVTGDIVNIDDSGNYTVNTSMGEVVFNQNEIVMEYVKITTTDGDRIIGVLQNEDNDKFHVKTEIGLMSIAKNNVNSIDFNYDDIESDDGFLNGLSKSDKRFYFGEEQLIDLIIEKLIAHLKPIKSWFSMPDFPYAETWWWVHSSREISNEWLINCLSKLEEKSIILNKFLEQKKGIEPTV